MCFDLDSHPPIAPIAGASVDYRRLTLTASDGTKFMALAARAAASEASAAAPSGAGIVVLPDVRGLHTYYEELALRFAEHGVDAVAIDYFARTAPSSDRGDGFDAMGQARATRFDGLVADIRAAASYLRSPEGGAVRSLFVVGFCFGGRLAFMAPTLGLDLAGAIGFYGVPGSGSPFDIPSPTEHAGEIRGAVLGLFGGADPSIPAEAVATFDAALTGAGVDHELVTYPGAPHSFFDRKAADYADASADAWAQVTGFIAAHA